MREKYYLKEDRKAFFYPRQFQSLLMVANKKQFYTLTFLINTGARINEARGVEWDDIDFERNNLILRKVKVKAKLKERKPNPRIIPISTKFVKFLKKNFKLYSIHSTPACDIFLKRKCKEIGLSNWKDFSAHNIRKTLGCWLLALGVNGFKVAQFLGHSPDTLRLHYASPDIFSLEDKDRMREILGDLPARMR